MTKTKLALLAITVLILTSCQSGGGATRVDDGHTATEPKVGVIDDTKPIDAVGIDDGPVIKSKTAKSVRLDTAEKLSVLIDKRLSRGRSDFFFYRKNGRLVGSFSDQKYSGTWTMENGFLCRTITSGNVSAYIFDCQVLMMSGDQLTIIREKGNGPKLVYRISG